MPTLDQEIKKMLDNKQEDQTKPAGIKQVDDNIKTFPSGAIRSKDADKWRFDLIPPHAMRRLAAIYAEGAEKYGDNNWRKGFPASNLLQHALNHYNLWLSGDASEDHLAKVAWGFFTLMEMERLHPNLIDIPDRTIVLYDGRQVSIRGVTIKNPEGGDGIIVDDRDADLHPSRWVGDGVYKG